MSLLKLVFASLCLLLLASACASIPAPPEQGAGSGLNQPATPAFATARLPTDQPLAVTPESPSGGTAGAPNCEGLDSALSQIVASPDPVAQAAQMLVQVKEGNKIQVALVLSGPDTTFLSAYDVEVGSQSGNNVQAFVPIARLCDLANTEQVLAINLPAQAITQ